MTSTVGKSGKLRPEVYLMEWVGTEWWACEAKGLGGSSLTHSGSRERSSSSSASLLITPHQLFFFFRFGILLYLEDLEFLTSGDPPALAYQTTHSLHQSFLR